jgi:integrase
LRPSEAIGLKLGDPDLNAGTLTIQRSVVNAEGHMLEGLTKTEKVQTIPMGFLLGEFQNHAKQLGTLDARQLLFKPRYSKSRYIHTDVLRGMVRSGGEKIGIEGLTSKVLRASAATNALLLVSIKFRWQAPSSLERVHDPSALRRDDSGDGG